MRNAEIKRDRIVRSAEALFHRRGYTATSLADIAGEAKVPLGNVYYYFKTKEDLVATVVEGRNSAVRERHLGFEASESPLKRLEQFLQRIHDAAADRAALGCPVGGLAQEANKLGGRVAEEAASTFGIMLDWVEVQFAALGFKPAEARERAVDLVASVQGSILLGHSARDPELIRRAIKRLQARLRLSAKGQARREGF